MAAFSRAETLARSRFAMDWATSASIANTSFKSRSYSSAQTSASVRVSTSCAFTCYFPARTSHCSLQHVGDTQSIAELAQILFAAVLHHARAADHLQIGNFGQFNQDVVLDAVGKERVFFLITQVFKRQDRDSSGYRWPDKFTFPNDPARGRGQSDKRRCQERAGWITSHPFPSAGDDLQCGEPELAHAATSVRDLPPKQEQTDNAAPDPSPCI